MKNASIACCVHLYPIKPILFVAFMVLLIGSSRYLRILSSLLLDCTYILGTVKRTIQMRRRAKGEVP